MCHAAPVWRVGEQPEPQWLRCAVAILAFERLHGEAPSHDAVQRFATERCMVPRPRMQIARLVRTRWVERLSGGRVRITKGGRSQLAAMGAT